MKYLYLILLLSLYSLYSCEEKMIVIPEVLAPTGNKTVLVEDLTGVRCSNCPKGAAKLKSLKDEIYGDKLIVVGVHGIQQVSPVEDGDYPLSNPFAVEIEKHLRPFLGKPAAAIDRIAFEAPDFAISGYDLWPSYIEEAFKKEVLIDIDLSSTWDNNTREINLNIAVSPQKTNQNGEYKVSVMLLESEITTAQEGSQGLIEEYEHHHVLRTMLTKFDGDIMNVSSLQFDTTSVQYQHILAQEDGTWRAEHMDIVVFITDANSKEVLQTKKIAVVK